MNNKCMKKKVAVSAVVILATSAMCPLIIWAQDMDDYDYVQYGEQQYGEQQYSEYGNEQYDEYGNEQYGEYGEYPAENPSEEPNENEFDRSKYGPEFYRGHYEGHEDVGDEYDDPCGEKAMLASLPEVPNRFVQPDDLVKYYRVSDREVSIYALEPGKTYYMQSRPLFFSALVQTDFFVTIDKVWEEKRGGIIGWFGDFTKRTVQYTDALTGEVSYKVPLATDLRFYEIEKIQKVTDPSISNQFTL